MKVSRVLLPLALAAAAGAAIAQAPAPLREAPARSLPVPTDVSPQIQAMIARPINPSWKVIPQTAAEWSARQTASAAAIDQLPGLRARMHVSVKRSVMGGVPVFSSRPTGLRRRTRTAC
jgi:monoterpene epsilon-lactone hydrolase